MEHKFNIEVNGFKLGVIARKSSQWGTLYKLALRPFNTETINPKEKLPYAHYVLTHDRRIQKQFLRGKPVRL